MDHIIERHSHLFVSLLVQASSVIVTNIEPARLFEMAARVPAQIQLGRHTRLYLDRGVCLDTLKPVLAVRLMNTEVSSSQLSFRKSTRRTHLVYLSVVPSS